MSVCLLIQSHPFDHIATLLTIHVQRRVCLIGHKVDKTLMVCEGLAPGTILSVQIDDQSQIIVMRSQLSQKYFLLGSMGELYIILPLFRCFRDWTVRLIF
jgi:hypothetical protein